MPGIENRHQFTYHQRLSGLREISTYCLNNPFFFYVHLLPQQSFFPFLLFLLISSQGGIEGKSYCVLWTEELVVAYMLRITGIAQFGFPFRVAPVSEDIYSIYHVYIARDLRETRMYYRHCTREKTIIIIHQPTPHTYYNTVIFVHVD